MSDVTQEAERILWQERRRQEEQYRQWLGSTLNSIYAYQWRCIAVGGNAVDGSWRFKPWPAALLKRVRVGVGKRLIRYWLSTSKHGSMPNQSNRATIYRRYGPFLKIIKPRYWSDCHGCEPQLFRGDPEWSLDNWLEHRRANMSDWTAEDDERERAAYRERYGDKP